MEWYSLSAKDLKTSQQLFFFWWHCSNDCNLEMELGGSDCHQDKRDLSGAEAGKCPAPTRWDGWQHSPHYKGASPALITASGIRSRLASPHPDTYHQAQPVNNWNLSEKLLLYITVSQHPCSLLLVWVPHLHTPQCLFFHEPTVYKEDFYYFLFQDFRTLQRYFNDSTRSQDLANIWRKEYDMEKPISAIH